MKDWFNTKQDIANKDNIIDVLYVFKGYYQERNFMYRMQNI